MSTYIELHTELADHPKVERLAESLGVGYATAYACLTILWLRAADLWPDGDLREATDGDVAKAARWKEWVPSKTPADFVRALSATGWLDADRQLHAWARYGIRNLTHARARLAKYRATHPAAPRPTPPRGAAVPTVRCPECPKTFKTQEAYLRHHHEAPVKVAP